MIQARLLIVDDDPRLLEYLTDCLTRHSRINVVGSAASGRAAINWLQYNSCDVILSALRMPDLDGFELLRRSREISPSPSFIAMTGFDTDESMIEALAGGASGYVVKGGQPSEYVSAVFDALEGGTALSPQCVSRLVNRTLAPPPSAKNLSEAELRVVRHVSHGLNTQQIAQQLHYSTANIKRLLTSIYRKMNVSNRTELIIKLNR
ncbi:response regulator transcription factor [Corynebacterium lizhenjunii]|uniref:Response regulator transcription factor n=1 Tax=Corynebacterium lizhenjunii TaxID=2709394 RepID=A0A7T0KFP7_9CORY|nr:response regulator transcription factor [Corynebacterium lizhenjunii]QPK79129.1 response regulator transcription factor [Corynebacterium lizhenjunii]